MSRRWPQSLNGAFLRQMIDFFSQNLQNFCYVFTKQSIISNGSSRAGQRWHASTYLAPFPESNQRSFGSRSPFAIFIYFYVRLVPVITFIGCREKNWKLFSCLIRTWIISQKLLCDFCRAKARALGEFTKVSMFVSRPLTYTRKKDHL